jgi:uncharacterized protein YbaP (TraB family)
LTARIWIVLLGLSLSACASLDRPFFYEIERNGTKAYVLGTSYSGWRAEQLPKYVVERLQASAGYASELHPKSAEVTSAQFAQAFVRRQFLEIAKNKQNDVRLRERLSPKAFAMVEKAFARVLKHTNPRDLDFYPPVLARYIVSEEAKRAQIYLSQEISFGIDQELDRELFHLAKKAGLEIYALDSYPQVPQACDDLVAVTDLEIMANQGADGEKSKREWANAFRSGDESQLQRVIEERFSLEERACVLDQRNSQWAEQIDQNHDFFKTSFIAVGAAHLVGEKSLFSLLRDRGFTVKRYQPSN